MKNTFKSIATFVALLSGFAVCAQNLPENTYGEENGIGYVKRATVNDDGTYTIDLETFVTGEVTQSYESVPADVVLVLDVSGSMSDGINNYTYSVANHRAIQANQNGSWDDDTKTTNYYYKYTDGNYYRVYIGRGRNADYVRCYFLFFTVNGVRYHINSSGQVVTNQPTNVTSDRTDLWNSSVTLYTRTSSSTGTTKIQALKTAVKAFIEQINENDTVDPQTGDPRSARLGNRIAIVAFSGASGGAAYTNHDNAIYLNTGWIELGDDIDDDSGYDDLLDDVDGLSTHYGTYVEYGMQDALALIRNSTADIRTVVLFTDGVPGPGTWGQDRTTQSANDAIEYSRQINAITIGSGDNATTPKIFAVGLFDEKPLPGDDTYTYMNYVSSNYPGARSMTNGGTKDSDSYYMDASGGSAEDLKDIFIAIAHSAGGSGNTDVAGTSTLTVDVVSSSFSVPSEFDTASDVVEVLVAPCTGKTTINNKEYLTFGAAKAPGEYGLGTITPSIDVDENKVSTTGFDYSANWCGPDPTNTNPQSIQPYYHGFKQIIRFTITVNDDAVGGPDVATNDSASGIYLPGSTTPLVEFNRPTVKLPVQIWIQKNGLRPGDSAVFTLAMCKFEEWDPEQEDINKQKWSSFTKVVINYSDMDDNGIVKIVGLDPDFFYRLKEDAWAFGYTYQSGGVQYTVGDNVANPFIFTNEPKDLKFDEASARNVFNEKTAE